MGIGKRLGGAQIFSYKMNKIEDLMYHIRDYSWQHYYKTGICQDIVPKCPTDTKKGVSMPGDGYANSMRESFHNVYI